jgi:SAM-dependent methyltransferase
VVDFDARVPHIARMYDYWLGGRDNFKADRDAAERAVSACPTITVGVRANRRFLVRAVRFMAEQGIKQFLDIGTGLAMSGNTHEVAKSVDPDSRVVYVDYDPVVLSHARAFLTGAPGAVAYVEADARDTAHILTVAAKTLDFTQPVGVLLIAILHCIPDQDDPYGMVATFMDAVPPGSYLAITHPAIDQVTHEMRRAQTSLSESLGQPITFRTREQVTSFFNGFEMVDDGVVGIADWRPVGDSESPSTPTGMWGGVALKR